jgi:DNA polymerase-3 subunit delta'
LEEPPSNCIIILSTNQPDLILPTVKSRCQLITLPEPTKEQASEYLKENNLTVEKGALAYFNSSPIQAIDQHDSYEKVKQITNILGQGKSIGSQLDNGDWLEFGLPWAVNVMQKWCYDLFSYKLTNELFYFPAKKEIIENLAINLNLSKILIFLKKLNEVKVYASKPVNKEINLELLIIEYRKVFN